MANFLRNFVLTLTLGQMPGCNPWYAKDRNNVPPQASVAGSIESERVVVDERAIHGTSSLPASNHTMDCSALRFMPISIWELISGFDPLVSSPSVPPLYLMQQRRVRRTGRETFRFRLFYNAYLDRTDRNFVALCTGSSQTRLLRKSAEVANHETKKYT